MQLFSNPILPGMHPDPSICRVGEDYVLVTSTFEWFPGLPVYHSRDLVSWRLLGHVLDRPEQLDLDGIPASGGLYAPTIRHHAGVFYVVCTNVNPTPRSFVCTATNPAGPWSGPAWIDGADGIDPSLLFDEDRVWYVGARSTETPEAPGRSEVYLREIELDGPTLVGDEHVIWTGALVNAQWTEGPHLYRIGDCYYLVAAEGGTGYHHAVTVARSESVTGPYVGNPANPVLTHRHLGPGQPVIGVGHADIVETARGDWWAVVLGRRPYGGYFCNLGRETFLVPVVWEHGWPIMSPGVGLVPGEAERPQLAPHPWPDPPPRDDFDEPRLDPAWNVLRTPREEWWNLSQRPGHLRLRLRPESLRDRANPSLVARRQQHIDFVAETEVDVSPAGPNECAGLVVLLNDANHLWSLVCGDAAGGRKVRVGRRVRGVDETLASAQVDPGPVRLRVTARGQDYAFEVAHRDAAWRGLAVVDGRILDSLVDGCFTGTYVGMYAGSNGDPSDTVADFDWFAYGPLTATPRLDH